MEIRTSYQPVCRKNFKAKFLYSDSLKQLVEYSVEKGKFSHLNMVRKRIESTYVKTRLKFDMGINEQGFPYVKFTRYNPKRYVPIAMTMDDYEVKKVCEYRTVQGANLMDFAYRQFLKLGTNLNGKKFRQVVAEK